MRKVHSDEIVNNIEKLCIESNNYLNDDVINALVSSIDNEKSPLGKEILTKLVLNAEIAKKDNIPICQDTGMTIVFVELGQEVYIDGMNITDAINEGVRRGYDKGFLRKSVVSDPIRRKNSGDNTPAIIHYDIVSGDRIKITVAPKGFGSENMSALKMLKPSDGEEGVKDFVIKTVSEAGANPCPPIIVGIGIGGTIEKAAFLAKKALLRPISMSNSDKFYSDMEDELLHKINKLGIGPQGFGGTTTALGVNIEVYPTHIAGLPVAVNISCHVTRHKSCTI